MSFNSLSECPLPRVSYRSFKIFKISALNWGCKCARKCASIPRFGRTDLDSVNRLIIAHEINCIIFRHITSYKMVKRHTTGKNFDNLLNFWKKTHLLMQNIGNFNRFYLARFEASSKYVIIKCRIIKHCYTNNKVWKYLKYKILKRKRLILVKYITIFIYLKKK